MSSLAGPGIISAIPNFAWEHIPNSQVEGYWFWTFARRQFDDEIGSPARDSANPGKAPRESESDFATSRQRDGGGVEEDHCHFQFLCITVRASDPSPEHCVAPKPKSTIMNASSLRCRVLEPLMANKHRQPPANKACHGFRRCLRQTSLSK